MSPPSTPTDGHEWRDPAFDVAWRILRDREAAGTVLETALSERPASLDELLVATRWRALAHLHERGPVAATTDEGLSFAHDPTHPPAEDPLAASELAWGAAHALGAEDASLVDLHVRFGVDTAVLARAADGDVAAMARRIDRLTGRLEGAVASWVIWNHGRPKCDELAATLDPDDEFDPTLARRIARHAVHCDVCRRVASEDRRAVERFRRAPVLRAPSLTASHPFRSAPPEPPRTEPDAPEVVRPPTRGEATDVAVESSEPDDDALWKAFPADVAEHGVASHDRDDVSDEVLGESRRSGRLRQALLTLLVALLAFGAAAIAFIATAPEAGGWAFALGG